MVAYITGNGFKTVDAVSGHLNPPLEIEATMESFEAAYAPRGARSRLMALKRVRFTFPENLIREPLIYNLGHEFRVITNVRMADVDERTGWVVLELEGDQAKSTAASPGPRARESVVTPSPGILSKAKPRAGHQFQLENFVPVTVLIPQPLRNLTGNLSKVSGEGSTLVQLVANLEVRTRA